MNVNSSSTAAAGLMLLQQQAAQTNSTSSASTVGAMPLPAATTTTSSSGAASTDISGVGSVLAQLQQMQETNPTEFALITGNMSQSLSADAQQGGPGSQGLQAFASGLATASQTGSLAAMTGNQQGQASAGATGAHHHHGGGGHGRSGADVASSGSQSVEQQIMSAFQTAMGSAGSTSATGASTTSAMETAALATI